MVGRAPRGGSHDSEPRVSWRSSGSPPLVDRRRGTAGQRCPRLSRRGEPARCLSPAVTPPGGPVPTGFRVADLSFVGNARGLGAGYRALLAQAVHQRGANHRTAGRAGWASRRPSRTCTNCTHVCVSGIRFATPNIGYAFRSALEMTTNGGSTWHRQRGNAIGLGITNGTAVRVAANHPGGCPPGCTFRVLRSAVGSDEVARDGRPARGR